MNKAMFHKGSGAVIESLREEKFDLLITGILPQDQMLSRTLGIRTIMIITSTIDSFQMSLKGIGPQHSSHLNFISSLMGDLESFPSLIEAQLSFKMRCLNFFSNLAARLFSDYISIDVVSDLWPKEVLQYIRVSNPPILVIFTAIEGLGLPLQVPMSTKLIYPKYK